MQIGSKEHYDILAMFDKTFANYETTKEIDKDLWKRGYVYCNGKTNDLYKAYLYGYAHGKRVVENEAKDE
jgi:hypothetical protein